MQSKIFVTPMDKRKVQVEISNESIDFYFLLSVGNQWFYDIPKNEWRQDYPRWQNHMNDKRWFTSEMEQFINENTKINSGTQTI